MAANDSVERESDRNNDHANDDDDEHFNDSNVGVDDDYLQVGVL